MKYVVQLKYTNPAHEHVSLRRRVDTINRIVEASSEEEAINRSARQQRALGFLVQEAKVVDSDAKKEEPKQLDEAKKPDASLAMRDELKNKMISDKDKQTLGKVATLMASQKKKDVKEEVELDEAQKKLRPSYWKAEWRLGTQSEVDKNNKKIFDRLAKTDPVKASAFHDNLMRMKKKDVKEEVEQIDEGATRWEYSGTVNGKDYTITVPRGADLSDHLGHKKIQRENPHLEPHEVKAVADTSGEDEEHVEVEHGGKKYTHRVTNNQEPRMVYNEDVELDEANMRFDYEAAARPKSSDVKNFLNRDKNARAAAASKKYIRRMTKIGGLGPNQTKKDTEAHMKAHFEEVALDEMDKSQPSSSRGAEGLALGKKADPVKTDKVKSDALKLLQKQYKKVKEEVEQVDEASKEGKDVMRNMRASLKSMDLRHGVDSDKREAGYKMSPAVKAAQANSDALSKVVKRPQAGTLAAAKMKTEAMDPNESKGEKKIVKTSKKAAKAAEKMVNAAKGKMNKINIQPTMDVDVKSK